MSNEKPPSRKRGRPRKYEEITVSQVEDNAKYHREYYHKVLRAGRLSKSKDDGVSEQKKKEEA